MMCHMFFKSKWCIRQCPQIHHLICNVASPLMRVGPACAFNIDSTPNLFLFFSFLCAMFWWPFSWTSYWSDFSDMYMIRPTLRMDGWNLYSEMEDGPSSLSFFFFFFFPFTCWIFVVLLWFCYMVRWKMAMVAVSCWFVSCCYIVRIVRNLNKTYIILDSFSIKRGRSFDGHFHLSHFFLGYLILLPSYKRIWIHIIN